MDRPTLVTVPTLLAASPSAARRRAARKRVPALAFATVAVVALLAVVGGGPTLRGPSPAGAATAATLAFTLTWTSGALPDSGQPIAESSPAPVNFPSGPAVVVGDRSGKVYAFPLASPSKNAASVTGWPADIGSPVTSTPSVEPLSPGAADSVFVGAGNAAEPTQGGYYGIGPYGNSLWYTPVTDPGSDTQPAYGVQASLSVGPLDGAGPDVVAGSLDQEEYALNATSGGVLGGWPFFTSDSVFSTASLADLYGTGQTDVVEGGDQTTGFGFGQDYTQGGHVRILSASGDLICDHSTDQTVDSSPAVGGFLAGGATGVVVGTGSYFAGASDSGKVIALDNVCNVKWSTTLDGTTNSSPALADLYGTGKTEVVEGTEVSTSSGSVWVLTAATGAPQWHVPTAKGTVIGSVTTADLTGLGYQDLLVPTTQGVDIIDGRSHQVVKVLNGPSTKIVLGFQNSPLVTDDPNGTVGITLAGYGGPGGGSGYIEHYEIPGSDGAMAVSAGSWPEFHHDPQLTGDAGPANPAAVQACQEPAAARGGYNLVASDGGIFSSAARRSAGRPGAQR